MNKPTSTKAAWKAFYNGDPISDQDLVVMILEAEEALRYLENRGTRFYLAAHATRQDLSSLHGYASARGIKIEREGGFFPIFEELLRADGLASSALFTARVKMTSDDFMANHRGEHRSSSEWNSLFQEFVRTHLTKWVCDHKKTGV